MLTKQLFRARRVLVHAINLQRGTDGFTSDPKEIVLLIFIALEYPSSSAEFEPANLVSSGKHAITRLPWANVVYLIIYRYSYLLIAYLFIYSDLAF